MSSSNTKPTSVVLSGDVDCAMTGRLLAFLGKAPKGDNVTLTVYINSYGGDPEQAFEMYDMIKTYPATINTHAFGACMSAATLIACAGRNRYCTKETIHLIHFGEEVSTSGTDKKRHNKIGKRMKEIYKKSYTASARAIGKWCNHDRWFDAKEALKYGLVDEVRAVW